MTATFATLLKVSDIRSDRARRGLAKARQDHGIAETAVGRAREAAEDLRALNVRRRADLRSDAMAGPRSLSALREHLADLRSLDAEEAAADARIAAAEAESARAHEALVAARRAFAQAERARETRREALVPMIRAERRAAEMREEREAEELRARPIAAGLAS